MIIFFLLVMQHKFVRSYLDNAYCDGVNSESSINNTLLLAMCLFITPWMIRCAPSAKRRYQSSMSQYWSWYFHCTHLPCNRTSERNNIHIKYGLIILWFKRMCFDNLWNYMTYVPVFTYFLTILVLSRAIALNFSFCCSSVGVSKSF